MPVLFWNYISEMKVHMLKKSSGDSIKQSFPGTRLYLATNIPPSSTTEYVTAGTVKFNKLISLMSRLQVTV